MPNPMHSSAIIDFQIPTAQKVTLRIYNATGQLVKTLVDSYKDAGIHRVVWNGLDEQERVVPHGIYFYQLQGEADHATRKLVVTR
jgi:flagellar hook assembly protein FlgD